MKESARLGWILGLVSAAQFVLQLDFSIVNVALPTIQTELDFSPALLQWIVTGYALAFGALLLLGGRLGDLGGHRTIMVIGLVLFGVSSLSAGLAASPALLIVSRFVQGASAALVAPQALAMITDSFAEGAARTRALGIFQGSTAAGATAGIVFGGILTQAFGWRAIFLVNPPIIIALLILILRFLPRTDRRGTSRLDIAGSVLVTASIGSLIFGLSEGQQNGFGSPEAIISLVAAVVIGTAFVIVERRIAAPMIPGSILVDRGRRTALIVMLIMGAVVASYVYFISLYLQDTLHFSALGTGLALVPATGTVLITSTFLTRRLLPRLGVKRLLLIGLLSVALGQLWLVSVSVGGNYLGNVLPGLLLSAFGMGLVFPTVSVSVTAGTKPDERGLAGGLLVAAQQVGAAMGVAALVTIAAARTAATHVPASGYQLAFAVAVGVLVVAMGIVLAQRAGAWPGPATKARAGESDAAAEAGR